jgi:hypothetical protein
VDSRSATTSDRSFTWWNATSPKDYVSASGEVRFSVRATRGSTFRLRPDFVRFRIDN